MKLWIWKWVAKNNNPTGYNSCRAKTREAAAAIARVMENFYLQVDWATFREGTAEELRELDRDYSSLFD